MARLTFQSWLKAYGGAEKLAKRLKVSVRVVHRWRRGEGWPKIETCLELVKISSGALSLDVIVATTWPVSKRGDR